MLENTQLDAVLVNFVCGKAKNVKTPMNLTQLSKEFNKKSGKSSSVNKLLLRLREIRDKMSDMENFDIDTKVKIVFALGSPVSNGFLIELRKQADIELDEQHRIIKYNSHGNGLKLNGIHIERVRSSDMKRERIMLNFLAKKSENVTSPMTDNDFLKEFNSSEGTLDCISSLKKKYGLMKKQIYLSPEFDQDTKIKMMFLSNTKVHRSILDELREEATVEVDEHQRITKYEANNGSLKLEGKRLPIVVEWSKEENDKLLNFIAEKSKQTKVPLCFKYLCREFVEKKEVSRTMDAVRRHIRRNVLIEIPKLNDFDIETKMRMMFALSIPVDRVFLNELRKEAVVELDEDQKITNYKANYGSLQLERKLLPQTKGWSKEENDKLLNYLAEKSKQTIVPLLLDDLCKEFAEMSGVFRTKFAVEKHIIKYILPNISKLDDFDIETRMRMTFALSAPVDQVFLRKLQKDAIVEVDEWQKITKYKANNGSLELEGERLPLFTVWSNEEKDKLWNFLAEKSKQTNVPLNIKALSEEFAGKNEISRTTIAVQRKIPRIVIPKFLKQDDADMETRIRMIFALSVPIDEEFLNELQENAVVKVDKRRRITKYKSNDGSLELNGDHSQLAKIKTGQIKQTRNCEKSDDYEIDEETEDDDEEEKQNEGTEDSGEDVEEVFRSNTRSGRLSERRYPVDESFCYSDDTDDEIEDEESEEKENEFEANSSTRKSERVSKKRYPDNVSISDVDGFSFDYPENVNDSSVQKETEDIVEKSSDSSSEVPLVKNLKRKNVENPFDVINSSSESRKYGKVDTQNDAESDEIDNGTKQNEQNGGEFKCDRTGEALSYKEVKLEDEEYKPDLSFLFNTTRNNMKSCSVVDIIRTDGVDHSQVENSEEMTSGKEFMKLLRGLVETLDSPILLELQSKIEEAIEKLGDRDHNIPIDDIFMTLSTGLIILNKNATIKSPTGESTSLRDFFLILRSTLSTFCNSSLNHFQLKLKENIKKLNSQDKIVSIESIRPVLETVLLLVNP